VPHFSQLLGEVGILTSQCNASPSSRTIYKGRLQELPLPETYLQG